MSNDNYLEGQIHQKVDTQNPPDGIDLSEIEIDQGTCFLNSYRVSKKYPNVKIVEGFIITVSKENKGIAMAHVWNQVSGTHFDVTNESIWKGREELSNNKEIRYTPLQEYSAENFKVGDEFQFSETTTSNVDAINGYLENLPT